MIQIRHIKQDALFTPGRLLALVYGESHERPTGLLFFYGVLNHGSLRDGFTTLARDICGSSRQPCGI